MGVLKKWAPSHTTADSSRTYHGNLAAPTPKLAQRTSEATGIDFFESAAPPGATFRERRKKRREEKKKRKEKKIHVTGATGTGLFLFPGLGRRRERLRAQLIIFRLGRGWENKMTRRERLERWKLIFRAGCGREPSCVQLIFLVTIDFYSTWPWGSSQRPPAPAPRTRGGRNRPLFSTRPWAEAAACAVDYFSTWSWWAAGSCAGGDWSRHFRD